jgi:hypothetical protein
MNTAQSKGKPWQIYPDSDDLQWCMDVNWCAADSIFYNNCRLTIGPVTIKMVVTVGRKIAQV